MGGWPNGEWPTLPLSRLNHRRDDIFRLADREGRCAFGIVGCRDLCAVGKGALDSHAMTEPRRSKNPRMSIRGF